MKAENYFRPMEGYFWVYEEQEEVFETPLNSTICYRPTLEEIMEGLADDGLPPFGALLLAMFATNRTPLANISKLSQHVAAFVANYFGHWRESSEQKTIHSAFQLLYLLNSVPPAFTQGDQRLQLLQALFAHAHKKVSRDKSRSLVRSLTQKRGTDSNIFGALTPIVPNRALLLKDMACLALLHRQFPSVEAIQQLLIELPEVDLKLSPKESSAAATPTTEGENYLNQLLQNPKTFQVAALTKHLWSGLSRIMPRQESGRQPMGGVADITNSGHVHQLLLSEFAMDQSVFFSRVANGEALYYQREKAPEENDREQQLLIDISLKNWGMPKVLGHAVALALQEHPNGNQIEWQVQLVGETAETTAYTSEKKLIRTLAKVDATLHAGAGLEEALKQAPLVAKAKVSVVTSTEALAHPQVQRALALYRKKIKWLIVPDRKGTISVYLMGSNQRKMVQQLHLNAQQIWAGTKSSLNDDPLPVVPKSEIKGLAPLLFSLVNPPARACSFENGTVIYTKNGNLYYLAPEPEPFKGAELLAETPLSGVSHIAAGRNAAGDLLILLAHPGTKTFHLYNCSQGTNERRMETRWKPETYAQLYFHKTQFIYQGNGHPLSISPKFPVEVELIRTNATNKVVTRRPDERTDEEGSQLKQRLFQSKTGTTISKVRSLRIQQSRGLFINQFQLRYMTGFLCFHPSPPTNPSSDTKVARKYASEKGTLLFDFPNQSMLKMHLDGMLVMEDQGARENPFHLLLKAYGEQRDRVDDYIIHALGIKPANIDFESLQQGVFLQRFAKQEAAQNHVKILESWGAEVVIEKVPFAPIYLPAVVDVPLGVACGDYFAGNAFFEPTSKAAPAQHLHPKLFYRRFIFPFYRSVLRHGV